MSLSKRRRSFLKSLASVPLLGAAYTDPAQAQAPSPTPVPPSPSPSDAPAPMARALAEAARHRFGAHLAPADLEEIEKIIDGNLKAADRLRSMKLGNADEPVTVFAARPSPPRDARKMPDARGPRRGVRPVRLKEH